MTRLKIAVIQMDAAPAPTLDRLHRAADLVAEAAASGAQIAVLPELFNTGYEYSPENYLRAEPIDGQTARWMKSQAAQHNLHLAGTFLLRDEEDIYNAALLVAPDGRTWRYNKQYPFAWERVYFREDRHITIADTDLGKIGMMICWDSAHPDVWERYAGKVDAMLIMSCPPKISSADLVFPDGERINMRELGGPYAQIYTDEEHFPGQDMDAYAAWMGVPVAATVGAGKLDTAIPNAGTTLAMVAAARPDLWNRLSQAEAVRLQAGYDAQTKVISGGGEVLTRVRATGDGLALAEVEIAAERPMPKAKPPKMHTLPAAYLMADVVGAGVAVSAYREGIRKALGRRMAPIDPRTRVWLTGAAAVAAGAWVIGRMIGRRGGGLVNIRLGRGK